uniref:CNH domain-containing protein n=1 Tax=Loa loa TaxID=7209 RepID=A0A1I7VVS2_LOALO
MVDEYYRLIHVFETVSVFAPSEKVTCVDGTSRALFVGTSQGRILLVNLSTKNVINALQLSTNAPIARIVAATALDYLIVLSASTIFNIEIKTLKPISSSAASNIAHLALNKDPVVADPFALQFALVTNNRYILVCESKADNLVIQQEIRTEDNVVALSYNKYGICYALPNAYFVYNILENKTLSLFPYDSQAILPIIINIDSEEFLVNGMQGLGVFATSEGVSSRPPLFWGLTSIVSFAYRSPHVFVLTASSITVYSSEQSVVLQRWPFTTGTLLECIDGQLYVCSSENISHLEEISWLDRAEALADSGELDEALRFAENAVSNGQYDEAEILKFNELKQKVALMLFKREEFEKFYGLAVLSELDPRAVLISFEFLLPFPSGFRSELSKEITESSKEASDDCVMEGSVQLITFLEHYLRTTRKFHWTAGFRRDIDALLLRLISLRQDALDAEDMSLNLHCTFDDCNEWMRKHKHRKFLITIAFCLLDFDNALAISQELYNENLWDDGIAKLCLQFFPRFNSERTILGWVEFLLEVRQDDVIDGLRRCPVKLDHRKIVRILQRKRNTLIKYLEGITSLQNIEFHSMLFSMYVDEINALLGEGGESEKSCRRKLRTFLLQPNKLNLLDTCAVLKSYPHFAVELTLLEGVKDKGSIECLEKLLNDHKDYDAAELFCIYTDTSEHVLRLTLLKFYLRNVASQPEFGSRITNLLNTPSFTSNGTEIMQNIPKEWSLSSILCFAEGTVLSTKDRSHCQQLKKKALKALSKEALKAAQLHIQIDEKTTCTACGAPISNEDAACYPNSSQSSNCANRTESDELPRRALDDCVGGVYQNVMDILDCGQLHDGHVQYHCCSLLSETLSTRKDF